MSTTPIIASALSIGLFTQTRPIFPEGPVGAASAGAITGFGLFALSHWTKSPIFPETKQDVALLAPSTPLRLFAKGIIGHAALFTTFEGLRTLGRYEDATLTSKCTQSFFAAGISGLVFQAAVSGINRSPIFPEPKTAFFLLSKTFLMTGCIGLGIVAYEEWFECMVKGK